MATWRVGAFVSLLLARLCGARVSIHLTRALVALVSIALLVMFFHVVSLHNLQSQLMFQTSTTNHLATSFTPFTPRTRFCDGTHTTDTAACACATTAVLYVVRPGDRDESLLRASVQSLRQLGQFMGPVVLYTTDDFLVDSPEVFPSGVQLIDMDFDPRGVFGDISRFVADPITTLVYMDQNMLITTPLCDLFHTIESLPGHFMAFQHPPHASLHSDPSIVAFDNTPPSLPCLALWSSNIAHREFDMHATAFTGHGCHVTLLDPLKLAAPTAKQLLTGATIAPVLSFDPALRRHAPLVKIQEYGETHLGLEGALFRWGPSANTRAEPMARRGGGGGGGWSEGANTATRLDPELACPEYAADFGIVYLATQPWAGMHLFRASFESLRNVARFRGPVVIISDDTRCVRQTLGPSLLSPDLGPTTVISSSTLDTVPRNDPLNPAPLKGDALGLAWQSVEHSIQYLVLLEADVLVAELLCPFFREVMTKGTNGGAMFFKDHGSFSTTVHLSVVVVPRRKQACLLAWDREVRARVTENQQSTHRELTSVTEKYSLRELDCMNDLVELRPQMLLFPDVQGKALKAFQRAQFVHITAGYRFRKIPRGALQVYCSHLSLLSDPYHTSQCIKG